MRLLYLYSGNRKNKFSGTAGVDYPDTQLYGLNHLSKFGIDAESKEIDDLIKSPLLRAIVGFRLRHLLLSLIARKYNVVFGSSLLYTAVFKKFFCSHTKFVLLNISTTRTVESNSQRKIKSRFIKFLLKEMDYIVCLSHYQLDFIASRMPELRSKLCFVPLGVDVYYYQPKYDGRADYVLSVGRDNGRDYQTVVDVARIMPQQNFQIVCSKRNIEGIKNIPLNVEIIYDLSSEELRKKYLEAKALLLLTHRDGQKTGSDCSGQTVLLDAMACGLPIVVSKKKYLDDYVVDTKEAIVVEPYDAAGVQIAIDAIDNVVLRTQLAKEARKRVESDFSTESMARSLADLLEKINYD